MPVETIPPIIASSPVRLLQVSGPALGDAELKAVADVFASGYLGMGDVTAAFEKDLAAFLGGQVCAAGVSSGTSAMHLACAALDLGPGDEVLVPSITFVATFQAVACTGAKPVPCDVNPRSALLDLEHARKRITGRTRAILPVHYAGYAGNLTDVYALARQYGLRVIEDAAHAFGSHHRGRLVGSFGDVICFSFDPIKNITCGEGGAVVTADAEIDRRVRAMRRVGMEPRKRELSADACDPTAFGFDVTALGWRYHLPNMLAAIGRVQLRRFESELKPRRAQIDTLYRSLLAGIPAVELTPTEVGVVPHLFAVRVPASEREALRARLRAEGFESLVQYPPAHCLNLFKDQSLPGAEQWFRESFTLPLHHGVSDDQARQVCSIIRRHFGGD